ncbi:hypothetical protein EON64_06190 [archaeon]|nr:MAG: hypothetical protein EON64_06190 [archaeon]
MTRQPLRRRDWKALVLMWATGTHVYIRIVAYSISIVDLFCRMIERLTNGHKFIGTDPLDLIKFICKEFWEEVFKKKVDFHLIKYATCFNNLTMYDMTCLTD